MRRLLVGWMVFVPGVAAAQDGASLGEVAQRQAQPSALEEARELLTAQRFVDAALAAYLGKSLTDLDQQDEATYLLGKALYRLKLYHSALEQFGELLEKGPDGKFFGRALEWCLFVSRNLVDDASVNELIALYGGSEFPSSYRDEFLFRLARYNFVQALALTSEQQFVADAEPDPGPEPSGGLSIEGDIFGTGGGEAPQPEKGSGGGLSLGGDLFGTGEPEEDKQTPGITLSLGGEVEMGGLSAEAHLAEAEKLALRVDETSDFGPRAKFLQALVSYKNGRDNDALAAFKDVIRITRKSRSRRDQKLRELAFFQLARTHFGAQQPSFSIFYYDKIDRDSVEWLDALFEESWAQFRLGNYEKALGNLLTLHSPFFRDAYFPESLILKAVIYYENCRYPEANEILADFLGEYEPVLTELSRITNERRSAESYFDLLDSIRSDDLVERGKEQAETLGKILELALADPELARLDASQSEVQGELTRLADEWTELASTPLARELETELQAKRGELIEAAGRAVERRLLQEQAHIKGLVQQAIRIDIETARSEQERIESRLRNVQTQPKRVDKTYVEWTDDEKLVWPFEGEYWRDELGTYELTLARTCR